MTTHTHRQSTLDAIAADIRTASIGAAYLTSLTLDGALTRWVDLWEQGRVSEAGAWWWQVVAPRIGDEHVAQ